MRSFVIASVVGAAGLLSCVEDTNNSTQRVDGTCETWEVSSGSQTISPPDHKLYRFSLSNCVTISQTECLPEDPGPDVPDPGPDVTPPPPTPDPIDLPPDPGADKPGHLYTASTPVPQVSLRITSITSNEVIEVGQGGDGHTTIFDAQIDDATHFELRAERQGASNDRIYFVNFVDQSGVTGTCKYVIPHDGTTNFSL